MILMTESFDAKTLLPHMSNTRWELYDGYVRQIGGTSVATHAYFRLSLPPTDPSATAVVFGFSQILYSTSGSVDTKLVLTIADDLGNPFVKLGHLEGQPTERYLKDASDVVIPGTDYTILTDSWQYVEVKITATSVQVWVDDVLAAETLDRSFSRWPSFAEWYSSGWNTYNSVDNVYYLDDTGSAPFNDRLGVVEIVSSVPYDDSSVQWTPSTPGIHATLLDEVPYNTTDYVEATSAATDLYLFNPMNISLAGGESILGVQLDVYAKRNSAGSASPIAVVNGQEIGFGQVSDSYGHHTALFETSDGSTPWTPLSVDTLIGGIKV